jgi:hypothetical protein
MDGIMGQLAHFVEFPPDILDQIMAGADPKLGEFRHYSLDKAWDSLHLVLRSKGLPLSLAITGDLVHPQGGHSLGQPPQVKCPDRLSPLAQQTE